MLGRIAGREIVEPPRPLLGNYLNAGKPDAIIAWLNSGAPAAAGAYVVSSDMLVYGGLVASRIPGSRYVDAYFRLGEMRLLRSRHPQAWIGVFGTIMRLAPTGVPSIGAAANFFAVYPAWLYLQQFANLHDPPLENERAEAARLRALIGEPAFEAYLQTRNRNYGVDALLVKLAEEGAIDRLVLGQDDAGPVGLHVKEVAALQAAIRSPRLQGRVAIEPGADELGMAMVAHAIARGAHWTPHVAVRYSMPNGGEYRDPLEYAPIHVAIEGLIRLCGAVHDDAAPDITLYVRDQSTDAAHDAAMLAAMRYDAQAGHPVAFADLSFLTGRYDAQAGFARQLLESGLATKLDAYASWNTNANTVGTALAESIAAESGRRTGTYDGLAHKEFTFDRIVDDYAFHDRVRPMLNAALDAQGVTDHMYLEPPLSQAIAELNRGALWNDAAGILPELYPGYHIAAMTMTLPWNRTFETEIDVALAPDLTGVSALRAPRPPPAEPSEPTAPRHTQGPPRNESSSS